MDIREFDLLYNKKSPLYDDDALRNLVHRTLVQEKVITSTAEYQVSPQSGKTSPCIQTSTQKRKETLEREKDEHKASNVKGRSHENRQKPSVKEGCIAALDSMDETFEYNTVACDGNTATLDYNTLDDTTDNVYSSTETYDDVMKTIISNIKADDFSRDKDRDISENNPEVAMLQRDVLNADSTTLINSLYAHGDTSAVNSARPTPVGASNHNTTKHVSNRMELGIRYHLTQNCVKTSITEPDNTNGMSGKHSQTLVASTMNSFRSNLSFKKTKSSTSDSNGKWCEKETTNRHLHTDYSCYESKHSQKETVCCAPVCSNSTVFPKFNDQMKTGMDTYYDNDPQFDAMHSFLHNANTGSNNSKSEYAYTVKSKLGSLHSVESKPEMGSLHSVESKPETTHTVTSKPVATFTVESKPETAINSESIPETALTAESKPWSLKAMESKPVSQHTDKSKKVTALAAESKPGSPLIDEDEITSIIDALVKANAVFTESPKNGRYDSSLLLIQKQKRCLEGLKHTSEDPLKIAKRNEETRRRLLESTVEYMEMKITESVRFAKQIPGFVQLPLDDQVNLIKASRTESGLCDGMRSINSSLQMFSTHKGFHFTSEDMKLVFSEKLVHQTMMLSKQMSALELTAAEEALLRALTITATDRCHLLCYSEAEQIQHKLMACLEYVISDGGKKPAGPRLGNIVDILVRFRYTTEVDLQELKHIFLEWPAMPKYELVSEYL